MDDYRDVDNLYRMSLEKIIMDAGLKLPSIWGDLPRKYSEKLHNSRVDHYRKNQE